MRKIRVLIVDDSVLTRQTLRELLSSDAGLEVVGVAANGRIALDKIAALKPDIVTLDLIMPELDGLQTLAEIQRRSLTLPVIVLSSLSERGAAITIDALMQGASDYILKPSAMDTSPGSLDDFREALLSKVRALCQGFGDVQETWPQAPGRGAAGLPRHGLLETHSQAVEIVAIGVSTGGPAALATVLSGLAVDFPVSLVIVQHMLPRFTGYLAQRLAQQTAIAVAEARSDEPIEAGRAWVAPGDFHMVVDRQGNTARVRMLRGPPVNSCRPAVDVLFESVAESFGAGALAVVMTGMGRDGLAGCKMIHEAGGQVIVQDEASSTVWGMPGYVARAGLADKVVPLSMMAGEINARVEAGRLMRA